MRSWACRCGRREEVFFWVAWPPGYTNPCGAAASLLAFGNEAFRRVGGPLAAPSTQLYLRQVRVLLLSL